MPFYIISLGVYTGSLINPIDWIVYFYGDTKLRERDKCHPIADFNEGL